MELLVSGQFLYFGRENVKIKKGSDVRERERDLNLKGCLSLGKDLVKLGLFQTLKNSEFFFFLKSSYNY